MIFDAISVIVLYYIATVFLRTIAPHLRLEQLIEIEIEFGNECNRLEVYEHEAFEFPISEMIHDDGTFGKLKFDINYNLM